MTPASPLPHDRLARVAAALALTDEVLLVGAGLPVPLPEGTDQTYPFRAHSEYVFLTGQECPGGIVAFDPRLGPVQGWISFVPEVTEAERIWEGREQPAGVPLQVLESWLLARRGRPLVALGSPPRGLEGDPLRYAAVRERFHHARRPKDASEVAFLRRSAAATAEGYRIAAGMIRPGVTERQIQIELEAGFARGGADRPGYHTIVGTGPNAAVLHFDPTDRPAREGEFVLIDAGAEVSRYVTDVTRTYVAGRADAFHRDLHQVVLAAEEAAIARCVPGAEWRDLHLQAAVEMMAGLRDMGLVRGDPHTLVESEAHTLFFPHGLGHLVGLGVRDASGTLPGRPKDPRPSLRNLRTDLPLAEGYVITVEPGLYFIPALLRDPVRRARFADAVVWERVDPLIGIGGVRIEDNILVTAGAPVNLTAGIPKVL